MSAPPFLAVPWTAVSVNELNEPEASATFRAAQLPKSKLSTEVSTNSRWPPDPSRRGKAYDLGF